MGLRLNFEIDLLREVRETRLVMVAGMENSEIVGKKHRRRRETRHQPQRGENPIAPACEAGSIERPKNVSISPESQLITRPIGA
jgi:hypothetical protein